MPFHAQKVGKIIGKGGKLLLDFLVFRRAGTIPIAFLDLGHNPALGITPRHFTQPAHRLVEVKQVVNHPLQNGTTKRPIRADPIRKMDYMGVVDFELIRHGHAGRADLLRFEPIEEGVAIAGIGPILFK